jgi:serine/threonine protein kinase/TolA-binding protein
MSVASESVSERELRFQEVAAAYLEAREAGRSDELSALLARHPDLADEVVAFVAGQDEVAVLAAPLRDVAAPVALLEPTGLPGTLGDFRIVREVGRGGMGIVYEAEQISLGRRVALKVLPFAATMDPRQLQRFHNEARAAAGLHHTNIVPVYGVGCERGVHYYAMQFIDGRTLAALIAEQRGDSPSAGPTVPEAEGAPAAATTVAPAAQATSAAPRDPAYFRRVAEWGIQAAEALDCAHTLGVVHRDVKPANLLVDTSGRLWVTDFGLAQIQNDARLTQTGDLVGTLRYMSPEQALAKRVVIDHRTDIYSLGTTLYELLTLQPAYSGNDRHELLRQIAFEEPMPPRRVTRAVPAELETLVLKAMEKRPQDRYATAQELADDLRHWLEDRPIKARRPSPWQVAARWARRHKPLVGAATIVLLLAAMMLAGTLGWVASDRAGRRKATEQMVQQALDESASWQEKRNLSEALSAARRAAGLVAGGEADEALRGRVQGRVDDLTLLTRLEEARLEMVDSRDFRTVSPAQLRYGEIFSAANLNVEGMPVEQAAQRLRDSSVASELAAVLDEWAMWRNPSLASTSAEEKRSNQIAQKGLLRVARAADPDDWRGQLREALEGNDLDTLRGLACSDRAANLPPPTLHALVMALTNQRSRDGNLEILLLRNAQRLHPDDFWINLLLGERLAWKNKKEEGIPFLMVAVALRPLSPEAHRALAQPLQLTDISRSIEEYRRALALDPTHAGTHYLLGTVLHKNADWDAAIAEFQAFFALDPTRSVLVSPAHRSLGDCLYQKKDLAGAIGHYRKAVESSRFHYDRLRLGRALSDKGDLDGAIAEFRQFIEHFDAPHFLEGHLCLGDALFRKGRISAAMIEFQIGLRCSDSLEQAARVATTQSGPVEVLPPGVVVMRTDRYNLARAATFLGTGQRSDSAVVDQMDQRSRRQQALAWLRADLTAWNKLLEQDADKFCPTIIERMHLWEADPYFAGVRGDDSLNKLPDAERQPWRQLWADVADLLASAEGKIAPEKKPGAK